jgi:hypothetical protein
MSDASSRHRFVGTVPGVKDLHAANILALVSRDDVAGAQQL